VLPLEKLAQFADLLLNKATGRLAMTDDNEKDRFM
jgi:hypothetical protein